MNGCLDSPRQVALQATFDLCPFMDELEEKHCIQDTPSTENFLQRLQQWSKALPQELRQGTHDVVPFSITTDRELFNGGTHVACAYYFAVILATRRFLTLYLLRIVRSSLDSDVSTSTLDDKSTSLALVCLNAAISLSKVAYIAIMNKSALNNMCLIK